MSEFNPNLTEIAQEQNAAQTQATPVQEQAQAIPTQVTTPHQEGQPMVVPTEAARPVLPPKDDDFVYGEGQKGLVVNTADVTVGEKLPPKIGELPQETLDNIAQYMEETDKEGADVAAMQGQFVHAITGKTPEQLAEEAKQEESAPKASKEEDEEEEKDEEETAKELEEKYSKAVVLIDKLGVGAVVDFTPEEREKLEHAKKIRLEEVETVNIKKFKTKKSKKNNLDNILKRQPAVHSTNIVLPASGYTASIAGASTYELISLMQSSENALIDTETKWSVIHNKLTQTSLGKMNFNDFLRATSAVDYNIFIYGLLCATYPNDDKLPLNCANEKCGKTFEHEYQVRGLLRAEKMSDKLLNLVAKVVDGSHTAELAKQVHEESSVNQVKTIKLPNSGYVLDIYVQSAHELLYNSIKGLVDMDDPKYNQASVLSTVVKTAYIPDPDEPGTYFDYSEAAEITKIIYSLQDTDILVLSKQSELIMDNLSFDFGLMNVKCPHCGHYREEVPFDIESILFYRYQQAMNTQVE